MSAQSDNSNAMGFRPAGSGLHRQQQQISYTVRDQVLRRILNFTGHTIDDVVNNKVAHRTVLIYYRMHKLINRESEISELERQWNPLG